DAFNLIIYISVTTLGELRRRFLVEDDHYCRNESEVDYGALKENRNVHEIGGKSLAKIDFKRITRIEILPVLCVQLARKIERVGEIPIDENVENGLNKHPGMITPELKFEAQNVED
ncbi:12991_t:CDS:2, partial [Racocetra persica]